MAEKSGTLETAAARESAPVKDKPKGETKRQPQKLPPYNVVLLNDDDHTYEYVIHLLRAVFAYPDEKGFALAKVVDQSERAIVYTTHRELAELKREQIQAFGSDPRIASCKGSMSAIIEPASS